MENKYYTPLPEEFHIGFEVEYFEPHSSRLWEPEVISNITDWECLDSDYIKKNYRVRLLDKEDILSLGWILKSEMIKSYGTYYTFKLGENEMWYAGLNTNFTTKGPFINITNAKYNGNFKAYLKNKSELKKLMKQLGIEREKKDGFKNTSNKENTV